MEKNPLDPEYVPVVFTGIYVYPENGEGTFYAVFQEAKEQILRDPREYFVVLDPGTAYIGIQHLHERDTLLKTPALCSVLLSMLDGKTESVLLLLRPGDRIDEWICDHTVIHIETPRGAVE